MWETLKNGLAGALSGGYNWLDTTLWDVLPDIGKSVNTNSTAGLTGTLPSAKEIDDTLKLSQIKLFNKMSEPSIMGDIKGLGELYYTYKDSKDKEKLFDQQIRTNSYYLDKDKKAQENYDRSVNRNNTYGI